MYNAVLIKYKNSYQLRKYEFPIKEGDEIKKKDNISSFENMSSEVDKAFMGFDCRSDYVSVNHSKQMIYYYSRSVDWSGGFFITLTFDPEKVDSFSYNAVVKKLRIFLDSLKRYDNSIKYLFVPELHKSGRFHFHGLITNCSLLRDDKIVDSHHTINGDKIYNFSSFWKYGFSTLSVIKNSLAVEKYIAKYNTKELLINTKYQHRYFVSNNIIGSEVIKIDYPFDNLIQRLYELDLVDYCNSDGCYNRVIFSELKKSDLVLQLLNDYVIK